MIQESPGSRDGQHAKSGIFALCEVSVFDEGFGAAVVRTGTRHPLRGLGHI